MNARVHAGWGGALVAVASAVGIGMAEYQRIATVPRASATEAIRAHMLVSEVLAAENQELRDALRDCQREDAVLEGWRPAGWWASAR